MAHNHPCADVKAVEVKGVIADPIPDRNFEGQRGFKILIGVDRGHVMAGMAGTIHDHIFPCDESAEVKEKLVQSFGLKHRAMRELVDRRMFSDKGKAGAVNKEGDEHDGP